MGITITKQQDNVLLDRKEVMGVMMFEGSTPSNKILTEELAKKFNTDAPLVVVKKINNVFSLQKAEFIAVVYQTEAARKKAEQVTSHTKKKMEEAKKAAA